MIRRCYEQKGSVTIPQESPSKQSYTMKYSLFVFVIFFVGVAGLQAQSLTGIWHCKANNECIDFTVDGRFKIFSDKYVRYGRYKIENNRLYLKEIGLEEAVPFEVVSDSDAHFVLSDGKTKRKFIYFDQTKMSHKEFQKAIAIYYHRDQYQKRLVSNY